MEGAATRARAGRTYYVLARQWYVDRRYPDAMWDSIQANIDGHDYREAIRVLEEYLQNEARLAAPRRFAGAG